MNTIKAEDALPENCKPVLVNVPMTYRFKHYKKASTQFKNGVIGRWQVFNGYGWDNTMPPVSWVNNECTECEKDDDNE